MTENSNQVPATGWLNQFAVRWIGPIFMGIFLLLPLAVSPFRNLSADYTKHFIFLAGIFFVFLLCLVSFNKNQNFSKPKKMISYGLGAVLLTTFLASLFSENFFLSFLGQGFEKDTFIMILALILTAFLPSFIYRGKDDLPKFGFWLAMVASVIIILEAVFLLLVNFADFNIFGRFLGLVSNSWYEEATFIGLIVLLILGLFEFFAKKINKRFSFFLIFSLVLSLLFLILINYWTVWLLLAIFSALIIVLAVRRNGWPEVFSLATFVLVISLVFVVWGGNNSWLGHLTISAQQSAKINILEVRPNWAGTYDVINKTLKADPVFGIGPSRFWHAWNLYKPNGVNLTPFWNTDFSYGMGFVPSLLVGHGLIVGFAWLILILAIIYSVFMELKRYWTKPEKNNNLLVLTIIPILYLWSLLVFRSPNLCILALAFAFLGWFMVSSENETGSSNRSLAISQNTEIVIGRISWIISIFVVAIIIYLLAGFLSLFALQRSLISVNKERYDRAYSWVTVAAWLERSDVLERQATSIKLAQINQLIKTSSSSPEQIQASFLNFFNLALKHATNAQKIDPDNYVNWLNTGRVYGLAASLGVAGAEDQALVAYQKALKINPTNPGILFEMAQLSLANKKTNEAKDRLNQAINLKPNYLEARMALAQLDLNDGLIVKAINDATETVKLSPEDYNAWFLLGYLKYQHGDMEEATQIFARTLQLQPNYADAKYFIGLSLDQMGRKQEALGVFKDLVNSNPGNKILEQIVSNLNADRPALSQPAVEKKPTKNKN